MIPPMPLKKCELVNPLAGRPGGALQDGMFIKFGTATPAKAEIIT